MATTATTPEQLGDRGLPLMKHGTRYAYRKKGCRCGLCRDWRRDEARRERLLGSYRPRARRARRRTGSTPGVTPFGSSGGSSGS